MTHSTAPTSSRLLVFLIGCLLAVVLFAYLSPTLPTAQAQDEPAAAEEPKADKPAETKSPNIFMHIIKSLSWFGPSCWRCPSP